MDGTARLFTRSGQQITNMGKVSCFAERAVVPESGCIPAGDDLPFENAALVGCSVTTGVGAALFNAKVWPGSTVAVVIREGRAVMPRPDTRLRNGDKLLAVTSAEREAELRSLLIGG